MLTRTPYQNKFQKDQMYSNIMQLLKCINPIFTLHRKLIGKHNKFLRLKIQQNTCLMKNLENKLFFKSNCCNVYVKLLLQMRLY